MDVFSELLTINISNKNDFQIVNRSETHRIFSKGNLKDVTINYYGDLRKNESRVVKERERMNASQEATKKKIAPEKIFPCIHQPIPNININDTFYTFNPKIKNEFVYQSGSIVLIDENAFVEKNGNNYDGDVTLFYREFRNPVDIMLSGIPMKNTINGEEKIFKSGGMYEIRAFDAKGEELDARTDSSVKINFALTDTSENFEFFSLNSDGSWKVTQNKVKPVISNASTDAVKITKAIEVYYKTLMAGKLGVADTTGFYQRFGSNDYLYTYRKDNLYKYKDSVNYTFGSFDKLPAKGFFKVKYLRRTKDKQIIFTLAYSNTSRYVEVPKYMRSLIGKTYLYTGTMTKSEFRKKFHRKLYGWDVMCSANGNELALQVKTGQEIVEVPCKLVSLYSDGNYKSYDRGNKALVNRHNRYLVREAKTFNKKYRIFTYQYNDMTLVRKIGKVEYAFQCSKKFQNKEELAMDFKAWEKYIKRIAPDYYRSGFQYTNALGTALVKSGMGIKNIDEYIHSGEMETIFVNYNEVDMDSLNDHYHVVLYKTINTSYTLSYVKSKLQGYYFKKKPNYIIRFSDDGFMQVAKPEVLLAQKKGSKINLKYEKQFAVADLNSREITRLILE
jgi:hypothetical protein